MVRGLDFRLGAGRLLPRAVFVNKVSPEQNPALLFTRHQLLLLCINGRADLWRTPSDPNVGDVYYLMLYRKCSNL